MYSLKDEVYEKCTQEQINSRNLEDIAATVNVGRTKANNREIGNGSIIETIGLTAGNQLLDVLNSDAQFKYVKPLLDQGRLIVSSQTVKDALTALVTAGALTQANADKLLALGQSPSHVSAYDISVAVYNPDGSII